MRVILRRNVQRNVRLVELWVERTLLGIYNPLWRLKMGFTVSIFLEGFGLIMVLKKVLSLGKFTEVGNFPKNLGNI